MLDWFFPFSTSSEDFVLVPGYPPCFASCLIRSLAGLSHPLEGRSGPS